MFPEVEFNLFGSNDIGNIILFPSAMFLIIFWANGPGILENPVWKQDTVPMCSQLKFYFVGC